MRNASKAHYLTEIICKQLLSKLLVSRLDIFSSIVKATAKFGPLLARTLGLRSPKEGRFSKQKHYLSIASLVFYSLINFWFSSALILVPRKERHQESPKGAFQLQHQGLHWRLSQANGEVLRKWWRKVCPTLREGNAGRHWQIETWKWMETATTRK